MDKEDVVCMYEKKKIYIYNVILLSCKKEQNNTICRNMDGQRQSY